MLKEKRSGEKNTGSSLSQFGGGWHLRKRMRRKGRCVSNSGRGEIADDRCVPFFSTKTLDRIRAGEKAFKGGRKEHASSEV